MKSERTYGTTEVTEKHSVSSRKKIKRQRYREVENRIVVEDEVIFRDGGFNH